MGKKIYYIYQELNFKNLDYIAPEMIKGMEYDNSIDNWCLGVLAYELCAGRPPFESNSESETEKKI